MCCNYTKLNFLLSSIPTGCLRRVSEFKGSWKNFPRSRLLRDETYMFLMDHNFISFIANHESPIIWTEEKQLRMFDNHSLRCSFKKFEKLIYVSQCCAVRSQSVWFCPATNNFCWFSFLKVFPILNWISLRFAEKFLYKLKLLSLTDLWIDIVRKLQNKNEFPGLGTHIKLVIDDDILSPLTSLRNIFVTQFPLTPLWLIFLYLV